MLANRRRVPYDQIKETFAAFADRVPADFTVYVGVTEIDLKVEQPTPIHTLLNDVVGRIEKASKSIQARERQLLNDSFRSLCVTGVHHNSEIVLEARCISAEGVGDLPITITAHTKAAPKMSLKLVPKYAGGMLLTTVNTQSLEKLAKPLMPKTLRLTDSKRVSYADVPIKGAFMQDNYLVESDDVKLGEQFINDQRLRESLVKLVAVEPNLSITETDGTTCWKLTLNLDAAQLQHLDTAWTFATDSLTLLQELSPAV